MPSRTRHYDDDFMMTSWKVKLCPRVDHHNWKNCPWRHEGESQAMRRHPSLYSPAYCADLKMHGKCAAGDRCPFSHNTFELSLHPERYKTTLCNLGEKCNRDICFFAHSISELRTPGSTTTSQTVGSKPKSSKLATSSTSAASASNTAEAAGGPVPSMTSLCAASTAAVGTLPLMLQAQQQCYQQDMILQEHLAGIAAQQQLAALCADSSLLLPASTVAAPADTAHTVAAQIASAVAAAAAAAAVFDPVASGSLRMLGAGSQLQDFMSVGGSATTGGATSAAAYGGLQSPSMFFQQELMAAAIASRGDSMTSQSSHSSSTSSRCFAPIQAPMAASMPLARSASGASALWSQLDVAQQHFATSASGVLSGLDDGSAHACLGQASVPVHVTPMLLASAASATGMGAAANTTGWPMYN